MKIVQYLQYAEATFAGFIDTTTCKIRFGILYTMHMQYTFLNVNKSMLSANLYDIFIYKKIVIVIAIAIIFIFVIDDCDHKNSDDHYRNRNHFYYRLILCYKLCLVLDST